MIIKDESSYYCPRKDCGIYSVDTSLIPVLPKKRVHPEQKKNKASPIAPPVAKSLKSPYSNFMCELVINSAVIHSVYLY